VIANEKLLRQVETHPYPLLFATISGAHLYGFPSPDSDYDLRGVHLLSLEEIVGLTTGPETIEKSGLVDGIELDLVTHDAKKSSGLLLPTTPTTISALPRASGSFSRKRPRPG